MFEVAHPDISFTYDKNADSPMLISDRRQLGQAITNILKNAAESIEERKKSGPFAGEITIVLDHHDELLTVSIADNGIGLPEDRDRILEPYITNRATGSGLGLAIVKKIIEEHFGEITLSDNSNGGAIVTLKFSPQLVAAKVGNKASPSRSTRMNEVLS